MTSCPNMVNSRLTQGECVPVSRAMQLQGIFSHAGLIASEVVGSFCRRMTSPASTLFDDPSSFNINSRILEEFDPALTNFSSRAPYSSLSLIARKGVSMDTVRQDVRFAVRTLAKSPGFAVVAVITLALGIGASTAIFSVIDNVLMEPFPYPDADRLMSLQIHDTERNEPGGRAGFQGPEFLDYVEQNHAFDRVIANDNEDVLYRSGGGTERFNGNLVTPGTFEFFGMPPLLGRVMQPADYEPGAPPVFVLRYKTWVTRFNQDPQIVNKTFILSGTPRTLIGIMPPRFGWFDADVFIPEKPDPAGQAGSSGWFVLGHLKPGVSVPQAEADLTIIASGLSKIYPQDYPTHLDMKLKTLGDGVVHNLRPT